MTLEDQITSEALKLGFDSAGFVPAGNSTTMEVLDRWLAAGNAAGMTYLSRNRPLRADIRLLEPQARSVLVAAARYPPHSGPEGGFSSLGRSRDYHLVLIDKLQRLAERIRDLAPIRIARPAVDATPLPERELGLRAGIGWRGRQGQLVSPTGGACVVLGELLLDIELRPSRPIPSRCGDCRLCVEACPNRAISDDGLVDARRCISCLTIEHKQDFTPEMRSLVGNSLFGCDRCTAVCPWNRKAVTPVMPGLEPREMPDAEEILRMTPAMFRERFRDTAVHRLGLRRLQRNAAAVLANRRRTHGA